jgi:hypothetical protein
MRSAYTVGSEDKMIICFECSQETKNLLDALIKDGIYRDYSEAISVALANQSLLQKQVSIKGAVVFETTDIVDQLPKRGAKGGEVKNNSNKQSGSIPPIFQRDHLGSLNLNLAPLPNDNWSQGQVIPLDRWLFGQYNKILPAKANCRALAHMLTNEPSGVPLTVATAEISQQAAILGDFLRRLDQKNGILRDEALATAFPMTGVLAEKSRLRYANQFVAFVSNKGQVFSLMLDLKLINHTSDDVPRLLLTEAGWRFATLANPVLDSFQEEPTQKFTTEEIAFLLEHITDAVPTESFAYQAILVAIEGGADTPDSLDSALSKYVSEDKKESLSQSFLSTQRSGAVSRMTDLGLVARKRVGVCVWFVLTDKGREFIHIQQ